MKRALLVLALSAMLLGCGRVPSPPPVPSPAVTYCEHFCADRDLAIVNHRAKP